MKPLHGLFTFAALFGAFTLPVSAATYDLDKPHTQAEFVVTHLGLSKVHGQIPLASGTMTVGSAGDPGFGTLSAGYLEASNVDLSQEFTNLIVAQRGFQANARIITTSDSVLEELVDLKRQ